MLLQTEERKPITSITASSIPDLCAHEGRKGVFRIEKGRDERRETAYEETTAVKEILVEIEKSLFHSKRLNLFEEANTLIVALQENPRLLKRG